MSRLSEKCIQVHIMGTRASQKHALLEMSASATHKTPSAGLFSTGIAMQKHTFTLDDHSVTLQLTCLNNDAILTTFMPSYFKQIDAVVLCYDPNNSDSFSTAIASIKRLQQLCALEPKSVPCHHKLKHISDTLVLARMQTDSTSTSRISIEQANKQLETLEIDVIHHVISNSDDNEALFFAITHANGTTPDSSITDSMTSRLSL